MRWVLDAEAGMQSVDSGDPAKAAPLDLKPGSINNDIDAAHVSHLPQEKFEQIEVLRSGSENQAVIILPVQHI